MYQILHKHVKIIRSRANIKTEKFYSYFFPICYGRQDSIVKIIQNTGRMVKPRSDLT